MTDLTFDCWIKKDKKKAAFQLKKKSIILILTTSAFLQNIERCQFEQIAGSQAIACEL